MVVGFCFVNKLFGLFINERKRVDFGQPGQVVCLSVRDDFDFEQLVRKLRARATGVTQHVSTDDWNVCLKFDFWDYDI